MALIQPSKEYLFLHKPVNQNYKIEAITRGKFNIGISEKREIERSLNTRVEQVSLFDFIDIAFPNAQGYFCIFQNAEDRKRNDFITRKDLANKLPAIFNYTWGMNAYVSYSTYNKNHRGFEPKEVPVTYKVDDKKVQATACDIETKAEYVIKAKKSVKVPVRVQDNIQYTYMLAQDLDFYKLGITEKEALSKISQLVIEGAIVCPTFIVYTGRGIQLIWCVKPFKNIKGYTNDREWRAVQETMISIFEEAGLNPDMVVKAPNAVTRLPQTPNRKTDTLVKAFYVNSYPLTLQDMVFFHAVLPYPDRKVAPPKKEKKTKGKQESKNQETKQQPKNDYTPSNISRLKNWNDFTLNRYREEDIFIFVKEAVKQDLNIIGKRTWLATILCFHALVSSDGDRNYAHKRLVQFWNLLVELKTDYDNSFEEMENRCEMAEKYYTDWVNGTWDKAKYSNGGLFYKNKTMLDKLGITDNYYIQWKMNTIKIKNNKYEAARKRFERLEKGQVQGTMEEYNERRKDKKEDKIWLLQKAMEQYPTATNKELAEKLDISVPYVKKLKSQINGKK
ncbi:hypothetical protein [Bacillus cereus group sp. BfR-BA-01491]|uniref:hypothetical protein n=1 Tax=Bacillus cereus group sp. BfR-BA-01491 TaxID=2920360 RepID=UPI001F569919|nr:hypothetical protein [Bacillus cereus group sp. BfR-BA-01491]